MMSDAPLLSVTDLRTEFRTPEGVVAAVDGLSFTLHQGETLAIVGESGSGKSVTALSIMGLLRKQVGRVAAGSIAFRGEDLVRASPRRMRQIRGNDISMIFQEPMTSLNPVYTVGMQIAEVLVRHRGMRKRTAWAEAARLLAAVRIPDPDGRLGQYPHQLSGGMRQRVMIAIALACNPRVLIADEPTTALDVTVQAQVLKLIRELKEDTGAAVILITHDLGVVAETAQRVVVMYAGRKVEEAPVDEILTRPRHPYTRGLLGAMPRLGSSLTSGRQRLREIPGTVPSPLALPGGCAFAPRCPLAISRCATVHPDLVRTGPRSSAACLRLDTEAMA